MGKSIRKYCCIILASCMMMTLLVACTGTNKDVATNQPKEVDSNQTAESKLEPVTLKIMLWGDKPNQFDEVVAEFEKRTKDTLNTKLNVTFTPQSDYVNKLKLKLSAGEQVDLAFDAPWMNMNQFIQQDNYHILDDYFFNDKYPGLKKAFSESFINNNKFMGTDNKLHVYGVPMGQYLGDLGILYYRKDLAEKYGMSEFDSYQDVLTYYDNVLINEKNMTPFIERNDGNYSSVAVINGDKETGVDAAKAGLYSLPLAPNVDVTAYIKDNKIVDASITGENEDSLKNFPAPYNVADTSTMQTVREWNEKGYTEKEPITRTDAQGTFTAGKAASMTETIANFTSIESALKAVVPSAELGMFLVNKGERELEQPFALTDFRVWNFLTVPKSSKNLERSMMFVNWLNENQDNHDLFELGIEGKHWVAEGADKFKYPDGIDVSRNYNLPGYILTWNPNYIRLAATIPDEFVQYYRYIADENTYMKSVVAGFSFNGDAVKNALANPDFGKIASEKLVYDLGMIADPVQSMNKLQEKWNKNKNLQEDIKTIKEELMNQLQAYLDTQN
ncbi:extracellular solute-binding protein [Paenibacillus sp. FA6]|uniref:extracellular solute-binding protein n=1 Tax=Paenibacillus sp. FA6 TaxID=3413029 RepID=UPI003F655109